MATETERGRALALVRHRWSVLLLAVLTLTGCVRPWAEADLYCSQHYCVYSGESPQQAQQVASAMETVFQRCNVLLKPPAAAEQKMVVNVYASRLRYRNRANHAGITPTSTGFYLPGPNAAIHILAESPLQPDALDTLRHEGLHQFIDSFLYVEVATCEQIQRSYRLPIFPLWLNEGLAMSMESNECHQLRAEHLAQMITDNQCIPLSQLLSRCYGDPFSFNDYVQSWSVVHYLLAEDTQRFRHFLFSCRQLIVDKVNAEQRCYSRQQWNQMVTTLAKELFDRTYAVDVGEVVGWNLSCAQLSLIPQTAL